MKKMLVTMLSAGAAVALALGGPSSAEESVEPQEKPSLKEGASLTPATPVVMVDGKPITKGEYDRAMGAYMRKFRQMSGGGGMHGGDIEPNDTMKAEVLEQLVDRELLYRESLNFPVENREELVEKEYEQIQGRFPSPEAFAQALQSEGLNEELLKDLLGRQVMVRNYVETEIQPSIEVTEADVAKFYEENQEQFQVPEQVEASHILIRYEADATDEEKAAARAKAEDLRTQAVAGEEFAELAKANSEDPGSAPQGGELGFFTRERMVTPFADAAFALEPGAISDVVETRFGYHVIKVTDRKQGGQQGLEEVDEKIAQFLAARALDQAVQQKVTALKKDAEIEVVAPHL